MRKDFAFRFHAPAGASGVKPPGKSPEIPSRIPPSEPRNSPDFTLLPQLLELVIEKPRDEILRILLVLLLELVPVDRPGERLLEGRPALRGLLPRLHPLDEP